MTPTDPIPDDLDADELAVHAVLDDEANAEERRRVARDPRLVARLEALRATATAIGTTPAPAADDALSQLRARALMALDEPAATDADEPPPPIDPGDAPEDEARTAPPNPATPITTRRPRRSLPPFPAVAAVVLVLLAIGVALVASGLSSGEDSASQGDATAAADGGGSATGSEENDAPAAEAAPTTTGPAGRGSESGDAAPDRGAVVVFPDDDALRIVLQDIDPATLDPLSPSAASASPDSDEPLGFDLDAAASRCGTVLEASDAAIGPIQAAALVDVDGVAILVLSTPVAATERAPASTRLTVLEAESCVPRFAVQRDP